MTYPVRFVVFALPLAIGCGGSEPVTPAERAEAVERELDEVEHELRIAKAARSTAERKRADSSLEALHPALDKVVARKTMLIAELEQRVEALRGELVRLRGGIAAGERPQR